MPVALFLVPRPGRWGLRWVVSHLPQPFFRVNSVPSNSFRKSFIYSERKLYAVIQGVSSQIIPSNALGMTHLSERLV